MHAEGGGVLVVHTPLWLAWTYAEWQWCMPRRVVNYVRLCRCCCTHRVCCVFIWVRVCCLGLTQHITVGRYDKSAPRHSTLPLVNVTYRRLRPPPSMLWLLSQCFQSHCLSPYANAHQSSFIALLGKIIRFTAVASLYAGVIVLIVSIITLRKEKEIFV